MRVVIQLRQDLERGCEMTVKEIAEKSGVKVWKVYAVAKELGRLPTIEEVKNRPKKPSGRKPTCWKLS